jgi:hypothetical protein
MLDTLALIDGPLSKAEGTARRRGPTLTADGLLPHEAVGGDDMPSTRQKGKVKKVMHEYKEGKLKSGSGRKVKTRKQAIAIAMSESGQSKRRKKAS